MSWNRKTKLVFSSLRSGAHPPRIFLESLFSNAFSPIHRHGSSISSAKFSGFSSISLLRTGLGICSCSPFLTDPKRFYYVDRYQVRHFKPRGPRRWFRNPRTASTVAIVSSGVLITVYFANLETVPCTNRRHFVLLSKSLERRIGEAQFQQIKAGFKGEILPAIHPDSIRVRLIAADIIDALQRGFSHEGMWSDIGYASMDDDGSSMDSDRAVKGTVMAASKEGKIMDNRWIQQWRKKGKEKGSQAKISHLEGLNWEVLVVNKPVVNAFCLPSGKIVLFTGLLDHFEADSEIATVIGHETHSRGNYQELMVCDPPAGSLSVGYTRYCEHNVGFLLEASFLQKDGDRSRLHRVAPAGLSGLRPTSSSRGV
ncbi:PREDICTED: uncharacterized protein LOC104811503 isoform X2 [Tarenaya hassleriana]|uniref:uncharacterized protein LOC104811503 isoform X2 n=1 Tax=Tarenaya hassleriana TaxID=28532 RepID=UPI00053C2631|nr:PREDICTED: uncharacterized protein LOC104811503 isoform X2 [Tarenaya hassleriana]